MSKAIIFDVDGVLLDWMTPFLSWLADRGIDPVIHQDDQIDYNLAATLFPFASPTEVAGWIKEFAHTSAYFSLPIVAGAISAVIEIKEAFPDWMLVAVTAAGSAPRTVQARASNISDLFPEISEISILPIGASKLWSFQQYEPGSFVIDDHPRYLREATNAGHTAIAFDRPYNRLFMSPRLFGWFGAAKQLLDTPRKVL